MLSIPDHSNPSRRKLVAVVFAIVLPSIVTWAYFFRAESAAAGVQVVVFAAVKVLQFAFPLVWVLLVERDTIRLKPSHGRGVVLGLAFGAVVATTTLALFRYGVQGAEFFAPAEDAVRQKISGWGIDRVWQYALLGLFYTICHSLLEEYYWRWFVFGQLRTFVSLTAANIIASLGFMAHHVLVLGKFFGFDHWATWVFSLCVAVGGMVWAWLYDRSGSLLGPWLSHLLVDAAIFVVGYQIVGSMLQG